MKPSGCQGEELVLPLPTSKLKDRMLDLGGLWEQSRMPPVLREHGYLKCLVSSTGEGLWLELQPQPRGPGLRWLVTVTSNGEHTACVWLQPRPTLGNRLAWLSILLVVGCQALYFGPGANSLEFLAFAGLEVVGLSAFWGAANASRRREQLEIIVSLLRRAAGQA